MQTAAPGLSGRLSSRSRRGFQNGRKSSILGQRSITTLRPAASASALFLTHSDRLADARALVRDRGSQFIDAFDEIFRTQDFKILKSPVRTPVANAFAERWIGSIRRELLDRTIIWNQRQLEHVVVDYIDHHNTHRPHRSLEQRPPLPSSTGEPDPPRLRIVKTTRCDGLINEYRNAA